MKHFHWNGTPQGAIPSWSETNVKTINALPTRTHMKITKLTLLVASLLVTSVFSTPAIAKQVTPLAGDIALTGDFTYFTLAQKGDEILQDAEFPTTATLTQLDGHNIMVVLYEDHGAAGGMRVSALVGTMTPSGVIKMTYDFGGQFDLPAYFSWHTGCTISGNFPIFYGTFDGERLVATTAFNSQCKEYTPTNDIFETPVDGPIHWDWTIDLTVDE